MDVFQKCTLQIEHGLWMKKALAGDHKHGVTIPRIKLYNKMKMKKQ